MTGTIDLNADLGEGMPTDDEMLAIVSSASIACGGHAGDAATMRASLLAARARGVSAGAHPGYADKENFGRKRLDLPVSTICDQVREQIAGFLKIAGEVGAEVRYIKLHGALANMAAEDFDLARAVFEVARQLKPGFAVLALDNSEQVRAAEALGMPAIREAYADRRYTAAGLLVPRSRRGAVLTDPNQVVEQAIRLAKSGEIVAEDGTIIRSGARSLCLHGDTPGAVALARRVSAALKSEGISIAPAT